MDEQWFVHKFGGTSLANAECMRKCIAIIEPATKKHRIAVVVSAMGGKPKVTDLLLDLVNFAARGCHSEISSTINKIREKHSLCVNDILKSVPDIASKILDSIDSDLKDIGDLLKAVQLMRVAHPQILELVSGYGEVWSATIMVEAMRLAGLSFALLNAREVLFVSEHETLGTKVHWEESQLKLDTFISNMNENDDNKHQNSLAPQVSTGSGSSPGPLTHLLITGYIASTLEGVATTLKRDGSDFSASIFGKLLHAASITIWTDVSGVYSADPNRVPEAQIISEVSFTEAIELAYFGAKVIHPKT
jgi:aspartokinase/homoserine dehydrogenase 1